MEDDGSARTYRNADLARGLAADLPESDERRPAMDAGLRRRAR
jgi:hypothetical protein